MSYFSLNKSNEYVLIELPEDFNHDATREFDQESVEWLKENAQAFVFDFYKCKRIHNVSFPTIAKLKIALEKKGVFLTSINVSSDVMSKLIQSGVESVFNVTENIQKIKTATAQSKNILASESLNVLLAGVAPAYMTEFDHEPVRGLPFIKNGPLVVGSGALCVVTLTENNLLGVVRFYFSESFLQQLQKDKFKKETKGISQQAIEDIESFTGNYFIKIQDSLIEKGYRLANTFPLVVTGVLSQLVPIGKEVTMVLPYTAKYGDFWVEVVKVR